MNHLLKGYHSNLSFKVEAMMYFLGLTKVIEEIRSNLEKMEINELQTYNFLHPSPATDLNYFYSKILEYLKNPLEINRRKYDLNISILIEEGELPEEVLELNSEELNLFLNIHLARIS
ncbi:hypothetical protein IRY55_03755 [Savagea sp. SN6]|uniref:Uncharacterized protein n=1 Tax=Savagea serpentis TaxID=2785297 RepID=A0A8J7G1K1_9BACL|nr:hypothetical protein [Savagea serpentis]MBF4500470.1 hypothetical protein [Savagea serpentis]